MRQLALDPLTGDLARSRGRLTLVDGVAAVRQKLDLRLSIWLGEWFADTSVGIPYLRILGVKGVETLAKSTLDRAVRTCPGVAALEQSSLAPSAAQRRAAYSFRARATTGEPVVVRDFVPGAP